MLFVWKGVSDLSCGFYELAGYDVAIGKADVRTLPV
jgi:hypothetical protein